MGSEMSIGAQALLDLEEFLDDVRERTGVSKEFLDAARPIVTRLFTEV